MGLGAAALVTVFATTIRYTYPSTLTLLPKVTAPHVADPSYSGTTFQFEGRVTRVSTLPSGILILRLYDPTMDMNMESSVFPSLGCLPEKPIRDETVRITGNLGMYRGRPQIRPLSADHVQVLVPLENAALMPLSAVISGQSGRHVLAGPLTVDRISSFTSQSGGRHVRLELSDARPEGTSQANVNGVMFEGDQTACELRRLSSGRAVVVGAEVTTYNGAPSLTIKRVVAAHMP